ncbi:hypothetical protein [Gilliamella sp. B3801]|uniref:hypothetical protein n=1 Tax=Gilliamella sp. B3801 TaxID=2817997 RepID=UPI0022698DCF|nr:hypothetical protein [Gilliamella sp. B3801]MCX8588498.1 hypothetical protein [Gilliamella sp. B3801]
MSTNYYAPTAYTPDKIPDQPAEPNKSWLRSFGKIRLPWGNTSQAVPISKLSKFQVKNLRYMEANYSATQRTHLKKKINDLGAEFNHECYRMPHVTMRLTLIGFLMSGGKVLFMISSIIFTVIYFIEIIGSLNYVKDTYNYFVDMYLFYLVPFLIWKLSEFIFKHYQGFFFAKNLGPQYEFNRRTGLVTLYDRKTKQASQHPFYEFDAYLNSFVSKQGIMQYQLYIVHRYSPKKLMSMYPLQGPSYNIEPHGAVWDFLQNYMDISQPLPDIPELEEYRSLDPVTAEHDKRTGRPADYWLNVVDEEILKQKIDENGRIIFELHLERRPDIMLQHVNYQS